MHTTPRPLTNDSLQYNAPPPPLQRLEYVSSSEQIKGEVQVVTQFFSISAARGEGGGGGVLWFACPGPRYSSVPGSTPRLASAFTPALISWENNPHTLKRALFCARRIRFCVSPCLNVSVTKPAPFASVWGLSTTVVINH